MVPLSGTTDDHLSLFMHTHTHTCTYTHSHAHTYTHSEISRNDDQLTELKTYKEFLDSLAPQVSSGQLADTILPSSHTNNNLLYLMHRNGEMQSSKQRLEQSTSRYSANYDIKSFLSRV